MGFLDFFLGKRQPPEKKTPEELEAEEEEAETEELVALDII